MQMIILMILKILGIILLAILGIFLFLVILVLFVPVRYSVSGRIEDGFSFEIKGKIRWLLGILSLQFLYREQEFSYILRIFGIRKNMDKKQSADDLMEELMEEETHESEEKNDEADDDSECDNVSEDVEQIDEEHGQKNKGKSKVSSVIKTDEKGSQTLESSDKKLCEADEKSRQGLAKVLKKIKEFSKKICETIKNVWNRIKNATDKLAEIKAFLSDETTKNVFRLAFAELKYLFRHFKFRKINTDLDFSTGDPATTGQALGAICLVPMMYQYQIKIRPDFEAESFYIKGTFDVAGHIRLIHVMVTIIRLIKEKDVRNIIKKVMDH